MSKIKSILAGTFGNALEWYDFTVYAFFAPVLAGVFFPVKNVFLSLVMTLSVFAASFLVRPLGAIFFGYCGDHFGRKKALIISIILMSCPTLLLAFLPGYASLGLAAPILLTLLRLLQGIAVSGEMTTGIAYLVEHAAPNRRGLFGSIAMCSAFVGILLSSVIATVITQLVNHDALVYWGWRVPFAIGGLIGLVGLMIRLSSHETQMFNEVKNKIQRSNILKNLLNLQFKSVTMAVLLTCVMAVGNYFLIAYFNTFLVKNMNVPIKIAMLINCISLLFLTLLLPVMGYCSDKFGRKKIFALGVVGFILFAYPIFWLMTQQSIFSALISQLLFALVLSPITGLIPTILAELFSTEIRNTNLSMGYNMSLAIFGGTAPLVALTLVKITGNLLSPAWYLIACAIVSLVTLIGLEESYQKKLH